MRVNVPNQCTAVTSTRERSLRLLTLLTSAFILWGSTAPLGRTQALPTAPLSPTLTPTASPAKNPVASPTSQVTERNASDIDAQQQEMQTRLAATQADLVKAQNAFKEVSTLDPSAQALAKERLEDLSHQSDAYTQIIDNLKNLRRLNNKFENARKEKLAWKPPSGVAPWPLSVADDLQFEILRTQSQIQ